MLIAPLEGKGGFLNPEEIVKSLNFGLDMVVADMGAGHGYFTIPIAKAVGRNGVVYALDILPEALENIHAKADEEGLSNIQRIQCDLEMESGTGLPPASVDVVLLANTLAQVEHRGMVLKEAKRILRSSGSVIVIERAKLLGPGDLNLSLDEVVSLASEVGLRLQAESTIGDFHYMLRFQI